MHESSLILGLAAGEYATTSVEQLVSQRKCPAYILPSRNLLGRYMCTLRGFKLIEVQIKFLDTFIKGVFPYFRA